MGQRDLFEITRATIPQIWTFVNSKLKCNDMNGVEGKFQNRIFDKARRDAPRKILSMGLN
jgi:hypothetical protein